MTFGDGTSYSPLIIGDAVCPFMNILAAVVIMSSRSWSSVRALYAAPNATAATCRKKCRLLLSSPVESSADHMAGLAIAAVPVPADVPAAAAISGS